MNDERTGRYLRQVEHIRGKISSSLLWQFLIVYND